MQEYKKYEVTQIVLPFSSSTRSVHSSKKARPAISISDTKLLSSMNLKAIIEKLISKTKIY